MTHQILGSVSISSLARSLLKSTGKNQSSQGLLIRRLYFLLSHTHMQRTHTRESLGKEGSSSTRHERRAGQARHGCLFSSKKKNNCLEQARVQWKRRWAATTPTWSTATAASPWVSAAHGARPGLVQGRPGSVGRPLSLHTCHWLCQPQQGPGVRTSLQGWGCNHTGTNLSTAFELLTRESHAWHWWSTDKIQSRVTTGLHGTRTGCPQEPPLTSLTKRGFHHCKLKRLDASTWFGADFVTCTQSKGTEELYPRASWVFFISSKLFTINGEWRSQWLYIVRTPKSSLLIHTK